MDETEPPGRKSGSGQTTVTHTPKDVTLRAQIHARSLNRFLKAVGRLAREVRVDVSEGGLSATVVDPSHVAMASLRIPEGAFTDFRLTGDDFTFGLGVEAWAEAMQPAERDGLVSIEVARRNGKGMVGVTHPSMILTVPWVDEEGITCPKLPAVKGTASGTVETKSLRDALKAANHISDHINLTARDGHVSFYVDGETRKVSGQLRDATERKPAGSGEGKSMYPLDFLSGMVGAIPAESVKIEFGTEYPLRLSFRDEELAGFYLLAPRVEE